jgi:hypothetical protein
MKDLSKMTFKELMNRKAKVQRLQDNYKIDTLVADNMKYDIDQAMLPHKIEAVKSELAKSGLDFVNEWNIDRLASEYVDEWTGADDMICTHGLLALVK